MGSCYPCIMLLPCRWPQVHSYRGMLSLYSWFLYHLFSYYGSLGYCEMHLKLLPPLFLYLLLLQLILLLFPPREPFTQLLCAYYFSLFTWIIATLFFRLECNCNFRGERKKKEGIHSAPFSILMKLTFEKCNFLASFSPRLHLSPSSRTCAERGNSLRVVRSDVFLWFESNLASGRILRS